MSDTTAQVQKFVRSLTPTEKTYLWGHVYRYAGVGGSSAKEQFKKLISYVLQFLSGESEDHDVAKRVYTKALAMFE